MIETKKPKAVPLRYSPKPIEDYNVVVPGGVHAGPGHSFMLRADEEAWNLAFLSHPYELKPEHPDPQFTTLVQRTVNVVLDTGEIDRIGRVPPHRKVRSTLWLPAPDFLQEIRTRLIPAKGKGMVQLVHRLPLYLAYGDSWFNVMLQRSKLCQGDDVPHIDDAVAVLRKFQ